MKFMNWTPTPNIQFINSIRSTTGDRSETALFLKTLRLRHEQKTKPAAQSTLFDDPVSSEEKDIVMTAHTTLILVDIRHFESTDQYV